MWSYYNSNNAACALAYGTIFSYVSNKTDTSLNTYCSERVDPCGVAYACEIWPQYSVSIESEPWTKSSIAHIQKGMAKAYKECSLELVSLKPKIFNIGGHHPIPITTSSHVKS
jgi:hypothetical protein